MLIVLRIDAVLQSLQTLSPYHLEAHSEVFVLAGEPLPAEGNVFVRCESDVLSMMFWTKTWVRSHSEPRSLWDAGIARRVAIQFTEHLPSSSYRKTTKPLAIVSLFRDKVRNQLMLKAIPTESAKATPLPAGMSQPR